MIMEKLMTGQRRDSEAWFFDLLRKAGEIEVERLLESDEAFEAFLRANPLSPTQEAEIRQAVERIAARFRGRPTPGPATSEGMEAPKESPAFASLHRNQGKVSPETEKRVEELRNRVRSKPKGKGGRK